MSRICLTLAEKDSEILEEKISLYAGGVGYIEIRIDALGDPECFPSPPASRTRFIATCRPVREGGFFRGEERLRLAILQRAAGAGFHWIDLEHDSAHEPVAGRGARVLRSLHDFAGFPNDPAQLFARLESLPGDGVKIAVTVSKTRELVELLQFMEDPFPRLPHVTIGMGPVGMPSRILGPWVGTAWTYVVESAEQCVAPGQFTLADASETFSMDQPDSSAVPFLYGFIGGSGEAVASVREANRALRAAGSGGVCVPLALDSMEEWFRYVGESRLPWMGFGMEQPVEARVAGPLGLAGTEPADTFVLDGDTWRAAAAGPEGRIRLWADSAQRRQDGALEAGRRSDVG